MVSATTSSLDVFLRNTSNAPISTDYSLIENKEVQYLLAAYFLLVLLSCLIGDPIILAASLKPNGIRLNQFIVTVMQHIAVSDLMACFTFVLPYTLAFIANKWVLGNTLNDFRWYLDSAIFGTNTILISMLSTTKFLLLQYPTRTRGWTVRKAHITCFSIWFFACIFPAMYFGFDTAFKRKWLTRKASVYHYLGYFKLGITFVVPFLVMIVTTILILFHLIKARRVAQKSGGRTRKRGIATVVTIVTVYCIAHIPFIWINVYGFINKDYIKSLPWIMACFTGLNTMCNIYVYCITIPSLRQFIRVNILRRHLGNTSGTLKVHEPTAVFKLNHPVSVGSPNSTIRSPQSPIRSIPVLTRSIRKNRFLWPYSYPSNIPS